MATNNLKKLNDKDLAELNKLMSDPKKRLEILRDTKKAFEDFFSWKELQDKIKEDDNQSISKIKKIRDKIFNNF